LDGTREKKDKEKAERERIEREKKDEEKKKDSEMRKKQEEQESKDRTVLEAIQAGQLITVKQILNSGFEIDRKIVLFFFISFLVGMNSLKY
jgi:predicted ATP-dependent protease